jgi:hypothetical protein
MKGDAPMVSSDSNTKDDLILNERGFARYREIVRRSLLCIHICVVFEDGGRHFAMSEKTFAVENAFNRKRFQSGSL